MKEENRLCAKEYHPEMDIEEASLKIESNAKMIRVIPTPTIFRETADLMESIAYKFLEEALETRKNADDLDKMYLNKFKSGGLK